MIVVHPSAVQRLSIETPEGKRVRSDAFIGSTLQPPATESEEVSRMYPIAAAIVTLPPWLTNLPHPLRRSIGRC